MSDTTPFPPYDAADWYWSVAGDTARVWSSARAAAVPLADAGYAAWLAAGHRPTPIDSEASLAAVLAEQYPPGWPASLAEQATARLSAGLAITSTATPSLSATYAVDNAAQAHIQAEIISILLNGSFADGSASVAWPDTAGVIHSFAGVAAFKDFAAAVSAYVAALFKVINGTSTALPAATATIA
jgi:hypothetical protein